MWWVPTGIFVQLPLHAAGYHTQGRAETVLDIVMSSYRPSVKALTYGRWHALLPQPGLFGLENVAGELRDDPRKVA